MVSAADRAKDPARTSVWLNHRPPSRARKADQPAGLDRDRITAATVRLLDAEGLAKFSMRRLAAELNVTAMSLYWYVDTKDDLLELALDSVYSEIDAPQENAPWETRLRALATSYRALLVRHVWVSPLVGKFLNTGPHAMLMSYAIQDVIRETGLPMGRQTGALSAVFQFVYGFGTVEGQFAQRSAEAGLTQDEYFQQAMAAIQGQPQLGPIVENSQDLIAARGAETVHEMHERDFAFALDLLIAGIVAMRERERSPETEGASGTRETRPRQ
ncbi:TetR/AcrR family transcriptional regulator C-terminal domain-containing protein [Streptomyces sp. P01-B04]|uniref:TetR/AcrR family transcriptional regulator n=1 Tax=Streptomyces poriferorum TaxID=2798799 RepID=A0ABY9IV91_9ACTN|nr:MULTISPECIES: TetR/AcrR family transcriptional regulator [Streptomyces]MBW5251972.1 TetR/AcrR family transcriptional regulator C-terminal domain-containing protein [Streptomyces poriferorum]MBW5259836.1 TetR/AcrR family transcriptional regulator C-terminal domain-containing protein [Streptomyces poriferorum]MDP5313418.1 TetR/AcrR family transcriptional regulator [Streptomyces sp. Alt4]WLQ57601.1 TetR/AcrR family transcriptional regulator [Streptomyces sp. Alt2]